MKIKRLKLDRLQNMEWFQFITSLLNCMEKYNPQDLKTVDYYDKLKAIQSLAENVIESSTMSLLTEKIQNLDRRRNELFLGANYIKNASLLHFDEEKRKAAKRVDFIFHNFGYIYKRNLIAKSAAIFKLVEDLRAECAEDLTLLAMTEWIDELNRVNDEFDSVRQKRSEEMAEENFGTNMVRVRLDGDRIYKELIVMIESAWNFTKEEIFDDFIKEWNVFVDDCKMTVLRRQGVAKARRKNSELPASSQ